MENNKWYEIIEKQINSLKDKMSKGDYSAFELDGLLRIAKRVSSLSAECSQCDEFEAKITSAIANFTDWPNVSKEQKDNYVRTFRNIVKHLENNHRLEPIDSESERKKNRYIGLALITTGIIVPLIITLLLSESFKTNGGGQLGDIGVAVIGGGIIIFIGIPLVIVGVIYVLRGFLGKVRKN